MRAARSGQSMLRDPHDLWLEEHDAAGELRLVPFLMLCYFTAFVDRVNAGFAALQMNKDVGLSSSVFGLGGGIFFIAYFLFEVPSNLALEKVGARVWIARIMITWGLISAAMALVVGALFVLCAAVSARRGGGRLLPRRHTLPDVLVSRPVPGRIVAIFMVAIPASSFIGSPISAALLGLEGLAGLHGWQWMFILEGLPAVLLGNSSRLSCCATGRRTCAGSPRNSGLGSRRA